MGCCSERLLMIYGFIVQISFENIASSTSDDTGAPLQTSGSASKNDFLKLVESWSTETRQARKKRLTLDDDLVVSISPSDCPSASTDCPASTSKHTDAFLYPVVRISSRQPFPPNNIRDIVGVTAAIISIDTTSDEDGGPSGSQLCSPDDEDCDVFSGSGQEGEEEGPMASTPNSPPATPSTDDIIYVHRFDDVKRVPTINTTTSSSTTSSTSTGSASISYKVTSSSTADVVRPTTAVQTSLPVNPAVVGGPPNQTHKYWSSTSAKGAKPGSDPTIPKIVRAEEDEDEELLDRMGRTTREYPNVFKNTDHQQSMNVIHQMTMNIGLILGIIVGLVLLLAMLAFVVFQCRTGSQKQTRDNETSACDEKKKAYYYEAALDPTSAGAIRPDSCDKTKVVNIAPVNCKQKDVKEWYV